jgi:nicotinamidase-related amidase
MVIATGDNTNSCVDTGLRELFAALVTVTAVTNARRQSNLIEKNFVSDLVTECLM